MPSIRHPRRAIYVLGAGGLAREAAQLVEELNSSGDGRWLIGGFVGSAEETGRDLGFARVVGDDDWLLRSSNNAELVVAIGDPHARARVIRKFAGNQRFAFPNLVHPSAVFDRLLVALGQGNVITAGCIFTCNIHVGNFNYFNLQTTVGHDADVGDFNVINPSVNVSGGVHIANRVLVGTGAQILENRRIGEGATVGAGAVVTKDVPDGVTVVGVPARPLEGPESKS